jgi:hypothetical protein
MMGSVYSSPPNWWTLKGKIATCDQQILKYRFAAQSPVGEKTMVTNRYPQSVPQIKEQEQNYKGGHRTS